MNVRPAAPGDAAGIAALLGQLGYPAAPEPVRAEEPDAEDDEIVEEEDELEPDPDPDEYP